MTALAIRPAGSDDAFSLTPDIARRVYGTFLDNPERWHSQPSCQCGDYAAFHSPDPPFGCDVCGLREGDMCGRYRPAGIWFAGTMTP